jgi:hypothetical protein
MFVSVQSVSKDVGRYSLRRGPPVRSDSFVDRACIPRYPPGSPADLEFHLPPYSGGGTCRAYF